jgi:hypothetical protein
MEQPMTDVRPLRRWPVRARHLLVIVLIVAFAVLAVRVVFDVWMGRRLNHEIARLEKQYGPLRWDPVRKLDAWKRWPRRIAPDNRARMLDAAAARVTLSDAYQNLLYRPNVPSTMTAEQVRGIADENRDAVQLAIRAARLRHSNWDIAYLTEPSNVPNLMDLGNLSSVLAIAARSDVDAGRADEAVADVTAGFAESAAIRSEPLDMMAVNAIVIAREQGEALKDILSRAEPSSAALASLAAAIDENLVESPMREAKLGELKQSRFIWPRIESGFFDGRPNSNPRPAYMRAAAWLVRPVIRFLAMRDLAEKGRAVDAASTPRSQRAASARRSLIDLGDESSTTTGLAATAVALRRFRLDRGTYPQTLDELAPRYLKGVPPDLLANRPPEYVRQGTGFELRAHEPVRPLPPGAVRISGVSSPWEWKVPR